MVSHFNFSNQIKQKKAERLLRVTIQKHNLVRKILNTIKALAASLGCKLSVSGYSCALYAGKLSLSKSIFSLYVFANISVE